MTTPPGPVFLSYTRIDLEFALRFAAALKNAGVPVWMDRFELRPGCDWRRGVEAGLAASAGMICVLSPDYVSSKYCLDELATVDRFNVMNAARPKPLFPAVIRPVPDERQPLEIRRLQYVHFYDRDRDWRDENLFDERLRQLLDGLRTSAGGPLAGDPPGQEEQYLNGLVAELETRRGVTEFVELAAEARAAGPGRPAPTDDEFGYAAMIEPRRPAAAPVELATIAEAAGRFDRFVLLGEPGAGKTTALRRLARAAARERLGSDRLSAAPLPLLVYLPQWTTEPTPAAFVRARWQAYGLPPGDPVELSRAGEVALYLDGLNEMGADGPRKAALLAGWLTAPDGPRRVTVTCRVRDYLDPLRLGELPTVTVRELDEPRVRQFAANYLGPRAADFLARVLPPAGPHRAPDPRRMSTLVVNPYLLGALVYLFEQSPGGDLPANNGALFRALARALWQRERQRGTAGWRPFEEVEGRFAALAFAMIDEGRPVDVPEEYAAEQLGDAALVRLGMSASFLQAGDGTVRFYHQLFQEYFAGVALLGRDDLERFVGAHELVGGFDGARSYPWDEPLIAACGITSDPIRVAERIGVANPLLAVRALVGGRHEAASVSQTCRRVLAQLELDVASIRKHFPNTDAVEDETFDAMKQYAQRVGIMAGGVGASAADALAHALVSPSVYVQYAALEGLVRSGYANRRADLIGVLEWWGCGDLRREAKNDYVSDIHSSGRTWGRGFAVLAARCLAAHGLSENRQLLRDWLRPRIEADIVNLGELDYDTCYNLCRAFPPLAPVVYDVFLASGEEFQVALADLISRTDRHFVQLVEPYCFPEHEAISGAVSRVVELSRLGRASITAVTNLVAGLLAHPSGAVRAQAVAALDGVRPQTDPEQFGREYEALVLPLVGRALDDPSPSVRRAALWCVYRRNGRHSQLLGQLERLAASDPDDRVKKFAAREARRLR